MFRGTLADMKGAKGVESSSTADETCHALKVSPAVPQAAWSGQNQQEPAGEPCSPKEIGQGVRY